MQVRGRNPSDACKSGNTGVARSRPRPLLYNIYFTMIAVNNSLYVLHATHYLMGGIY